MNTRLRSFIASALATTLMAWSVISYADDTEIYFAQANVGNEENKTVANVMIMLDTSGSMRHCEAAESGSGYNAGWCRDATNRRINILQNALDTLLDSVSPSIRLGIGQFNFYANPSNTNSFTGQLGGRILVPVTELTPNTKNLIRSHLSELNGAGNNNSGARDAMPVGDTPTAAAYSEAARYMMGLGTEYAEYEVSKQEYDNCPSTSSCRRSGSSRSYRYWKKNNYVHHSCQGEENCDGRLDIINGSAYVSPMNMNNMCESNHIILFTDGTPSADDKPSVSDVASRNCSTNTDSYTCQVRIASYLNNENNEKGRRVHTHNIGLYMGNNAGDMEGVSDAGGGATTNADSAEALVEAFLNNLDLIDGESRSTSAPGIAVNTMNRFQHLDELYYAVFQPADSSYWEGNLKSYRLKNQQVHGQNGNAIDPTTGYFRPEARSYWSSEADGADAQKGGAREQVAERKLFYSDASGTTTQLNWSSTRAQEPLNTYFGLPNNDNAGNPARTAMFERLKTMWGDPMHSVPLMVNYGGEQNYVFVSTNGGMLHIIDTDDGSEAATFMPHELFRQATKFTSSRLPLRVDNTRQTYGLDASWIAWRKPGATPSAAPSKVYLYGGMRRGGNTFYALDVTDPESPSLKWQITPDSQGFDRLGQTWSTPTLIRFPTAGGSVPALIFGGGYSPDDHDNKQGRKSADAMGNAVYVVNAETGDRIWTASHSDMKWAIPSGISIVDTDLDGIADFLYFGDLGGQLFRVSLDQDGSNHQVARIANLGGNESNPRRFYEPPSVAYVKAGAENHLYVAAASGYRAHPLDDETDEGLFVVIDRDAMGSSTSDLATVSNMANVVSNEEVDADHPRGWYYLFQADSGRLGEKALSSPSIYANTVMLSTYAPTVDQEYDNPCAVRYGAAYLHTVNLRTGAPASIDREAPQPLSRSITLKQSTPPPTPTMMIDEHGNLVIMVGPEVVYSGPQGDPDLRKRRWMQLPKNEAGEIIPSTAGDE